jgi:hypothetical protein
MFPVLLPVLVQNIRMPALYVNEKLAAKYVVEF